MADSTNTPPNPTPPHQRSAEVTATTAAAAVVAPKWSPQRLHNGHQHWPRDPKPTSAAAGTSPSPDAACNCTKIAIMQLFHEMKQEFATVPDYLVGQYVNDNCHNRAALVAHLQREAARQPGTVQAYPQALRMHGHGLSPSNETKPAAGNQQQPITTPSPTNTPSPSITSPSSITSPRSICTPTRPPPALPERRRFVGRNSASPAATTAKERQEAAVSQVHSEALATDGAAGGGNGAEHSDIRPSPDHNYTPANAPHPFRPPVPQRPSTLSLPPNAAAPAFFAAPQRPTRTAPRPPLHASPSNTTSAAVAAVATTVAATASPPPINVVSVNVTVSQQSPAAQRRTVRHTTELSVQPERWQLPAAASERSPLSDDASAVDNGSAGTPMRSFTSVQFKLRSPTTTAATTTETSFTHRPPATQPIDISAGPSLLTYSSASYDARKGLQSNFQITVDGGGNGTISAMRTRPSYARPTAALAAATTAAGATTTTTTMMPGARSGPVSSTGGNLPSWDEADIVHRQLLCKQRLCVELENDRMRLSRMQHEINTLRSPIPEGGSTTLEDEIERLQISCKQMVQQVEEAGPYVLGETNEAFYHQIISSQTPDHHPAAVARPPRPQPPRKTSANAALATPTTPATTPSPIAGASSSQWTTRTGSNSASPLRPFAAPASTAMAPPASAAAAPLPWACNMCTFQNHPLLNKCEQCEMPLLTTSGTVPTQTAPFASTAASLLPHDGSMMATATQHHPHPPLRMSAVSTSSSSSASAL